MNLSAFGVMLPERNEPSSMASCTGSMLVFGFCSTDVNMAIFKCLMTTYSIFQPGCCMDGFWLVDRGTHLLEPCGSNSTPNWKIEFVGLKLFLLVKCHPFYPDDST